MLIPREFFHMATTLLSAGFGLSSFTLAVAISINKHSNFSKFSIILKEGFGDAKDHGFTLGQHDRYGNRLVDCVLKAILPFPFDTLITTSKTAIAKKIKAITVNHKK